MSLLECLIDDKIQSHPLPWTIEYDWLVEIYDANHQLVIKMVSSVDAKTMVDIAHRLAEESVKASEEIERILSDESKI